MSAQWLPLPGSPFDASVGLGAGFARVGLTHETTSSGRGQTKFAGFRLSTFGGDARCAISANLAPSSALSSSL